MGVLEAIIAFAGVVGIIFAVLETKFSDELFWQQTLKNSLIKFGVGFGVTLGLIFAGTIIVWLATH